MLDRPVLITGTPRSGKTCVGNLLEQAGEFVYVNEPLTIWDIRVSRRCDDRLVAAHANDRTKRKILSRCEGVVRQSGRLRYLDNLAYHALRIPFIHAIVPDARIVYVIRNPTDTIPEMLYGWTYRDTLVKAVARRRKHLKVSALPRLGWRFAHNYVQSRLFGRRATWGPRVPGLQAFATTHSTAQVAAFQWHRMNEIGLEDMASLPAGIGLTVRYEDLLTDPVHQARRIASFCEVQDPHAITAFAKTYIDPNFPFDKKICPTKEQWTAIRCQIGAFQSHMGYTWSRGDM